MRKLSVLIIFTVAIIAGFNSCKVVKHTDLSKKSNKEQVTFYFESESFDAAAYVKANWESRIVPEIQNSAQPLTVIIEGLKDDLVETGNKFGVKKEESSPFSFAVSEKVIIKEIDTESSAGILVVDVPDLTAEGFCRIQIGPVIKKSMVRDYLSFIKFGDFENQIEYANVSRELNFYIRDNILNSMYDEFKEGSAIQFTGVFTYDKSGAVLITPIAIEPAGGDD